ncbi:DUF309 domain-containing protein [Alkalicoccus chagannorensis]|uniref:DUF309 domain-containing protein n=1 Tax=Alkalicoccus chagannorensis TaxID=427072 RepID=UPI00041C4085|nr:DUF309 domain-containing protein [Alkalicoccus chagannorensis]
MTQTLQTYPSAYEDFLVHFHATRDFFECHEILEDYWLSDNKDVRWLMLIQTAVALYHERQGNKRGAVRLIDKVLRHTKAHPGRLEELSVDENKLQHQLIERRASISSGDSYEPMALPVVDSALLRKCRLYAESLGLEWNADDRGAGPDLIYKHRRRDRSEVIEAREASLIHRRENRT